MRRNRIIRVVMLAACAGACGTQALFAQRAQPAPQTPQPAPAVKLVPEMPAAAPPRPFHFPGAVTRTLPNGLTVFVVQPRNEGEAATEPAVSVELLIRDAGSTSDPASKPGVASLAASLLTEGTETRSAQDIAGAIDVVGGTLGASAERDAIVMRASVVKKDFALAMDLLSDITLHAKFDPQEIERQREQRLSGMQVDYSDAEYLATTLFRRIVFGDSPYAMPPDGTPESVSAVTRDDLVKFRDQLFTPDRGLLVFAGDVTSDEAFAAAEKSFGAWKGKAAPTAQQTAATRTTGLRIVVVDQPDAVQTQIRVGRLGIPHNHPDYLPLQVTNQIFGGGYNSRLNTEVRLKKGLTYDASSDVASYLHAGVIEADTFTRTEETAAATKVVIDEIGNMAAGDVTADELNVARDYMAGVFTIATETPDQVGDRVLNAALYGLPEDYNQTFPEKVRGITAEQVHQMAARYFGANDLDIVLVGKASAFRDALKQAYPAAKYEEIPAAQLDLLAPGLRRAGAPAGAPSNPGSAPAPNR